MSNAAPSSAQLATRPREPSRGASASSTPRRAPVLLRVPALAVEAPERDDRQQPAALVEAPHVQSTDAGNAVRDGKKSRRDRPSTASYDEPDPSHDDHAHPSRRERHGRRSPRPESAKKGAAPSQWLLGGGMLMVGVVGFFALSGDFGGSDSKPPVDGWSQRSQEKAASAEEFSEPRFAETPSVTVPRESTSVPQAERNWSNPAEGEIAHAPPRTTTPAPTNWMSGAPSAPELTSHASETNPANVSAVPPSSQEVTAARPESASLTSGVSLTAPANAAANYPTTNAYPVTPATGLNVPTPAPPPPSYPTTGLGNGPSPNGDSFVPSIRTGMRDSGPSMYPTTSSGVAPNAYPSTNTPPAMSPRYERIR
jgi:hypothetical protein